ncbi:formate dehydrogenase subunit gamma [Benzoatithermus flavus]|uniref:Formate dehydrogenase subunit gamma n=1 Tax=Benzoatithermus flavus TaxID=3108223 RepID=A0ABU8XSZ6_9PROT
MRKRIAFWLAPLCLMLALFLSFPSVAQLYQVPGPNSPTKKEDVPIYRQEPDKIVGRVSIPDEKLATLIQPEGREWRSFRLFIFRTVATVLVIGTVLALAAFYLVRGRIRLERGWSGYLVQRFNGFERMAHWLTAVSFIVMALTGLVITFGRPVLIPLLGHGWFSALADWSKLAHNFFSVPFLVGVFLILILWIKDNLPERADIDWIKQGGGLFSGGRVHPEAGRFNAGQKLIFWAVVLGGIALGITGFMLMAPFAVTGIGGMQAAHAVHALVASVLAAVIVAHIYIGTLGMEGAFDAMGRGEVDANWAREHHSRWYEELQERGEVPRSLPAE